MQNPKLEFFRIKLNHKSGGFRTFRDFMVNNGKATRKQQVVDYFYLLKSNTNLTNKTDKETNTNRSNETNIAELLEQLGLMTSNRHIWQGNYSRKIFADAWSSKNIVSKVGNIKLLGARKLCLRIL